MFVYACCTITSSMYNYGQCVGYPTPGVICTNGLICDAYLFPLYTPPFVVVPCLLYPRIGNAAGWFQRSSSWGLISRSVPSRCLCLFALFGWFLRPLCSRCKCSASGPGSACLHRYVVIQDLSLYSLPTMLVCSMCSRSIVGLMGCLIET
jgi:hypothetical protein